MDSLTHLTQKLLAERARQAPTPDAPPPYTRAPSPAPSNTSSTTSPSDDEEEEEQHQIHLTLNAPTTIHGSNNLLPITSHPLADATRFSTLLLHAMKTLSSSLETSDAVGSGGGKVRVQLTINCGVSVIGDRNVVGNVGLRPRPVAAVPGVVTGAKRKAEEESEDTPAPKKAIVDEVGGA